MAKNPHFFVSFRPLLLFLPCILCIFFFFFFVLLLPLILLLLLLLLKDQIANFLGAFTLFQGKELCFFLCGKKIDTPLFCCVIHEVRPKGRGRIKNCLPHKTKQISLPWNKARNGKKSAFFCQFSSSASFSSVYFVYLFLLFFLFCYYHLYYYYFYYY